MSKVEKKRLYLLVNEDLIRRLKKCADMYGVPHSHLAVFLIASGIADIEKVYISVDELSAKLASVYSAQIK